jgi:hypothetical protein
VRIRIGRAGRGVARTRGAGATTLCGAGAVRLASTHPGGMAIDGLAAAGRSSSQTVGADGAFAGGSAGGSRAGDDAADGAAASQTPA